MKYEFSEMEARFLKTALIHFQEEISEDLIECTDNEDKKTTYYYFLRDRLDACNLLIDKLHNWGI